MAVPMIVSSRLSTGLMLSLLVIMTAVVIFAPLSVRRSRKILLMRLSLSLWSGIATVLLIEVGAAMLGEMPNTATVAWLGIVIAAVAARTV